MIKVLSLASFLALASGIACADSVVLTDGATWTGMPTSILNPGPGTNCGLTVNCGSAGTGPYWDNISGDGSQMNVGYLLTGTGGFSGDTDYDPLDYVSQNNGAGAPDAPTEISLLNTSSTVAVTLLGSYTFDTTAIIGYYNASATTAAAAALTEIPLYGPGSLVPSVGTSVSLLDLSSGEDYGFYLTKCDDYVDGTGSACLGTTTWFSNDSLDTTDIGPPIHQHFSIFDSPTTGIYYLGVKDWRNGGLEGYGDFNDVVFELNTDDPPVPTPEPATIGLIGAGLLGLGLTRLRSRRSQALS